MSSKRITTIGVIFGGRSVEHDVSVVTGHQVMQACDPARYEVVPLYITRQGHWYTGEPLRDLKTYQRDITQIDGVVPVVLSPDTRQHGLIVNPLPNGLFAKSSAKRLDIAFPALHGSHGEDGTIQGLFELAGIPYVGCGVMTSAVANDKHITKEILRQAQILVTDSVTFSRKQWEDSSENMMAQITTQIGFPLFVKPVTLGSSIGISRVDDLALLSPSIEVALNLDRRVMVERAVTDCVEINCSVMGAGDHIEASVLEQPVSWAEFLTYEEKYLRGSDGMKSADRIIPAPLSESLTQRVQQMAKDAFSAIAGEGIARIDFLVQPDHDRVYLNEINTLPGSLSFYLWSEMGMSGGAVIDRLVQIARDVHSDKRRNMYDYQTNLIALTASRGAKGLKGSKTPRATPR
jgi:D-alanine-D-alanine ligase